MNWIAKLAIGFTAFLIANAGGAVLQPEDYANAQSNFSIYRSATGETIFPASAQAACAGKVVTYNTRYRGSTYEGYLWVESPIGADCEGGRGRTLQGYFEERGSRNEWCRGRLTVYLTHGPAGGSYVRWDEIHAVPKYDCPGAGSTPSLVLYYSRR
jgi:hypothetical protein